MKLLIEIEMDNAAFEEGRLRETKRILTELTGGHKWNLSDLQDSVRLQDINGNTVGFVKLQKD